MNGTNPEIRKLLVLSTAHLTQLQRGGLDQVPADTGDFGGATVYPTTYGCFMWVPDDPVDSAESTVDGVPDNLLEAQKRARVLDCDYVMFDRDAEELIGLEVFDGD